MQELTILGVWNIQNGGQIPASLNDWNQKAIRDERRQEVEYQVGLKSYNFRIVSVPQTDYAYIYGTDITAEKLRCCGPLRYDVGILWVKIFF